MHDPDGEDGSHAQMARARAQGSVPRWGTRRQAAPASTTDSVRGALALASQRWGTVHADPVAEPPAPTPAAPQDDAPPPAFTHPPTTPETPIDVPRAPRQPAPEHPSPLNSWRGNSLPLRSTWATYCDGAARVIEAAPIAVVAYWALGLPAFALHCLFRLGQDSTTSLTRTFVFVIGVVILTVGIAIAL
jgi:hypothetical protein